MILSYPGFKYASPLNVLATYWHTSLGRYYADGVNRYLLYLLLTMLSGFFTFAALETYAFLRPDKDLPLSFQGMYAWETALNFGLCHYLLDEWLSRRWGRWGAFQTRSIGKVWLIGLGAYLLAFMIQRTWIYDTTYLYYPDLIIFSDQILMPGQHICRVFCSVFHFGLPSSFSSSRWQKAGRRRPKGGKS